MKRINVEVSKPYEVLLGKGLLRNIGEDISKLNKNCKIAIITDEIVGTLYSERLMKSLEKTGYTVVKFEFEPGEKSKTINKAADILTFLAENQISKSDLLIGLGGGVVGDLTGFCASIYLRGIPFVQVPTTILAAVDSSVGGKTGVDLPAGKNLVGTFYQPALVICDTETFDTLEEDIYIDGMCEVIKYGCILDKSLFDLILEEDFKANIEKIVEECIRLKAYVVAQDEFDGGIRQILNFGHTIGHGIEALSNYQISHGRAVAIGMYMIEKASGNGYDKEIKKILDKYNIESETEYSPKELAQKAKSDKKINQGNINLIVLEKIGKAKISPMSVDRLEDFFSKGV